ncbi:Ig-like domain-containing protein [Clostridium sp. HBUAS56017]|uniref:Ig-like domain-containing protein n=1 Tax=Clostridium sp. HBUAS56017 TaxID=2571128 RepID=UPI001177DA98|nr:Ig-like domain-containing protein [Clostridium sp. HBUAS56017]
MKKRFLLKIFGFIILGSFLVIPQYGCKLKDKEIVLANDVKDNLKSTRAEILKLIEEGNTFLESRKFSEARDCYEKGISKDKANEDIYLQVKDTYMKAERFDDAYYIIKLAIDNNVSKDSMTQVLEDIKSKFSIIQLEDTITQGDDYSLPNPKTIPIDTATNPVNIQWNKKDIDTSNLGIFTFDGYVEEYGRKVQLKLTIKEVVKQTNEGNKSSNKDTIQNEKSVNNKTITYSSKGLGVSFDMPASWENNYIVKDDGIQITVYMKHEDNDNGSAWLFTISSDMHDFSNGDNLDNIYDGIHRTINGKQYLVGGPTDIGLSENDSKFKLYQTMKKDCSNIIKSLRSA